jgi:hypothetical protein
MRRLLRPEAVLGEVARRFACHHVRWWSGGGAAEASEDEWPWRLPLGLPTAADALIDLAAVREWSLAWQTWDERREVAWEERQWPKLGTQRVPAALLVAGSERAAELAGQGERWQRAVQRQEALTQALPPAVGLPASRRLFDFLADGRPADVQRLRSLLGWAIEHPGSGLMLRQLPVPGLDTKWIEQRQPLVLELVTAVLQLASVPGDLHDALGLRRAPKRVRVRLLDARLRAQLGGLGDIEAPIEQIAALPLRPGKVLVVENLQTGLALEDAPDTALFMKLGSSVGMLAQVPWALDAQLDYWGDIDTHGLAILGECRRALPQTVSLLMDVPTLIEHRSLWVEEPQTFAGPPPPSLTVDERELFDGLRQDRWGLRLRLEQERIAWPHVQQRLADARARRS